MMVFFSLYGNTGAALPNDHEIIQLTEGGKLEEQQEPELTTPVLLPCSDGEDYP